MQVHRECSQEQTIEELQQQIAELKAENLQLHEQLARKEQFTAMIAHDLRGPLSPIINYAQMLAKVSRLPANGGELTKEQLAKKMASMQKHSSIIISQAKRMNRQVNDLLDVTNLSFGKFTLVREECDMVHLANDIVEQLRPVAPYHTLVVKGAKKPVMGTWDCGRLQQALGNLLDNAIKYSDEHTTVTVTVRQLGDVVRVSVHNQGASIPTAEMGQLFRPYMRLAATSSRQGSGLGLFITKSIIEAHGGVLRLEPTSEDNTREAQKGTTFTFELPVER